MIIRDRDYYICEGELPEETSPQSPKQAQQEIIEVRGNIRERLTQIKQRVETLKKQKHETKLPKTSATLNQVFEQTPNNAEDFTLTLEIPEELLKIQQRIESLEAKASGYEVYRQRAQRKGTVVDRVKRLQKKLEELLKAKSIEVVTQNIVKYAANLDEREQNMKQNYLYEIYTKTQGMGEELNILEHYLQNLNKVQRVVNSALPVGTLVANHSQILGKKEAVEARVQQLYSYMRGEYKQLIEEIDGIEV